MLGRRLVARSGGGVSDVFVVLCCVGVARTIAGLASSRARGRKGGRPHKMTPAKLRLAAAAMGKPETNVGKLCAELGISRQTLYRHISPTGELRADEQRLSQK